MLSENDVKKRTLVLSGINLFEGGPLSVYYDCLDTIVKKEVYKEFEVIIFVHKKELFEKYKEFFKVYELPKSRKNYINRLYYEYVFFYYYSKNNSTDIWVSMHDITPNVLAKRRYTYCHNATPFMKKSIRDLRYSVKVVAFAWFYKYLYRININKADGIIVQQDWMRTEFIKMFPIKNVIVAKAQMAKSHQIKNVEKKDNTFVFLYPSYARFFKNFETLLEASRLLEKDCKKDFEVWITMDGSENRYARSVVQKYKHLKSVKWMGILSRGDLSEKYAEADALVFCSTLESWGLPISEFSQTRKPMLLADLPYAHEALGDYDKVDFFDAKDAKVLSEKMRMLMDKELPFAGNSSNKIDEPFADNWEKLLDLLLEP